MDYLVSFNITENKTLLNPSNAPLLYYSSKTNIDEIMDEMHNNTAFTDFIDNNISLEQYGTSKITCFVFNMQTDEYNEKAENLQDIYTVKNSSRLKISYLKNIFEYLYNYDKKSKPLNNLENTVDSILYIYDELKNKYGDRISPQTLKEYIRSQLKQKYNLNSFNTNIIMDFYNELID